MIHGTTLMVAALAAVGSTAGAQTQGALRSAPGTVTALTIEEAVKQALEQNLNLLAERDNVRVADAAVLTASLRPNPVVTVGATRPDQSLVDAGISPHEQVFRTDYVIERGSKRERRVEQAGLSKSIAELQLANAMRTLILDVDDHALSWSAVEMGPERIFVVAEQSVPFLSLLAWKRRLLDGLAERCIRHSRRDPRDSGQAEQALFDQLDHVLDSAWQGQTAEAAAHYRDALAAGGPAVVRLNLARVLLAAGDREGTLRELDMLLATEKSGEIAGQARRLRFGLREPGLEHELERAGQAALAGDAAALDSSRAIFERALAIDPALWEAHFGIGIVARQRGDATAAQASFRSVLELSPDQPDALHELGVALLMGDDAAGALVALDHAATLRPDDPAYVADAGFAHLRAGDLARARQRLERAARLDANDPITKSYLGELERVEAEVGKR